MYSYKQLFNIFTVVNNNSDVSDRLAVAEENIKKLFENVDQLKEEDVNLKKYTDNEIMRFRRDFEEYSSKQEEKNGDL